MQRRLLLRLQAQSPSPIDILSLQADLQSIGMSLAPSTCHIDKVTGTWQWPEASIMSSLRETVTAQSRDIFCFPYPCGTNNRASPARGRITKEESHVCRQDHRDQL